MDHFWTLPRAKDKELLMKLAKKISPEIFHIAIKSLKGINIDNHISEPLVNPLWNSSGTLCLA
jgi:hypothetical protein